MRAWRIDSGDGGGLGWGLLVRRSISGLGLLRRADYRRLTSAASRQTAVKRYRGSGIRTYFLLPKRGYSQAQERLEYGLERLRQRGATVRGGEVGSSNALNAIRDALRGQEFDEIIVSTLPSGVSRWLHQDLPHRVERKFRLPVTVITPP
jgi:hypothetical protein